MSPKIFARCVKREPCWTALGCVLTAWMIILPARVAAQGGTFTAQSANANFYVATNGNDLWSGKLPVPNGLHTDGPFASLARAQIAVRSLLNRKSSLPIVVVV